MIERGHPLWEDSRVPRLCQVWSRQAYLWIMMILHIKNYFCKDTENELKSFRNKTNWANFVRMQDSWLLLKSDSASWRKTLKNRHNSQIQWPVVSIFCQETTNQLTRNVRFKGTPKLGPYWKLQPVACKVNMEWKSEWSLWTKTILTHGPEFLMAWISWSRTWATRSTTTTSRKPQKRRRKYLSLQADPRLKQNQEDPQPLVHLQGLFQFWKEDGLILNQELNSIKRTQWQED